MFQRHRCDLATILHRAGAVLVKASEHEVLLSIIAVRARDTKGGWVLDLGLASEHQQNEDY